MPVNQSTPEPDISVRGSLNAENPQRRRLSAVAKLWRPKNVTGETPASTLARYAVRLIDRLTGKAYSVDELPFPAYDRVTSLTRPQAAQVRANIRVLTYDKDITSLTGGTAAALDSLVTLGIPVGECRRVVIGQLVHDYVLVAGTNAEASPYIIRPDDYATTTNEKVWRRIDRATPGPFANDAAAASAGVVVGQQYYVTSTGVVQVRLA